MANVPQSFRLPSPEADVTVTGKTNRDPRADARYARGRAALEAHALEEAVDLFEQAIELAPIWIGAHLGLAEALLACGDTSRGETCLRQAASLDATDRHGTGLALARLGYDRAPARAPSAYVSALFDDYAPRFETHLTQGLGYSGPADLSFALEDAGFVSASRALDLGCGTGLCGAALRASVAWLTGVDLAARMVAIAAAKTIAGRPLYDRLEVDDLQNCLLREPEGTLDLVTAADVFIYIGDLAPVLTAVRQALRPGGFLAFTVQSHVGTVPFLVGADLRFAHAPGGVTRLLDDVGFASVFVKDKSVRHEKGRAVPGLTVVARHR